MKIFLTATLLSLLSLSAYSAEDYESQCRSKMIITLSNGDSELLNQIDWICSNATEYTNDVIDYVLDQGFRKSDSLAFLAGGKTTGYTKWCISNFIVNRTFYRSDSLAMICREISKESAFALKEYLDKMYAGKAPGLFAVDMAYHFSRPSLISFLKTYKIVYETKYCSDFPCPTWLTNIENSLH